MKLFRYIIIALVMIAAIFYFAFDRVVIYQFAKSHNLAVSYRGLKKTALHEFKFTGMRVMDNNLRMGFYARSADIRPQFGPGGPGDVSLAFHLYDVNFIKAEEKGSSYDTLTNLISVPFDSSWRYSEIYGALQETPAGMNIKNLMATSDTIKLSFTGTANKNSTIDADIVIYFSEKLTAKIPQELSKMIMRDEKDGWKSLTVKVAGDLNAPAIQVSSNLFRLNIKSVTDKPGQD